MTGFNNGIMIVGMCPPIYHPLREFCEPNLKLPCPTNFLEEIWGINTDPHCTMTTMADDELDRQQRKPNIVPALVMTLEHGNSIFVVLFY